MAARVQKDVWAKIDRERPNHNFALLDTPFVNGLPHPLLGDDAVRADPKSVLERLWTQELTAYRDQVEAALSRDMNIIMPAFGLNALLACAGTADDGQRRELEAFHHAMVKTALRDRQISPPIYILIKGTVDEEVDILRKDPQFDHLDTNSLRDRVKNARAILKDYFSEGTGQLTPIRVHANQDAQAIADQAYSWIVNSSATRSSPAMAA